MNIRTFLHENIMCMMLKINNWHYSISVGYKIIEPEWDWNVSCTFLQMDATLETCHLCPSYVQWNILLPMRSKHIAEIIALSDHQTRCREEGVLSIACSLVFVFWDMLCYLRHGEGYVFIVVCCSVCLSVCLLATLRKNGWTDFHVICRVGETWYMEILGTFSGCSIKPLWTQDFFPLLRSNPCLLQLCRKTVERIFMTFSEKDGHDTGSNLEYFRDVTVNPLNPGSIYLFPGSVFYVILWKNGWTDFHEIFMKRQAWHKKQLARHTCLDCFMVSHLGVPSEFLATPR